ncbi:phosphate signaling complex protein PhoU [Propionibacteriaceae bacterium Y1685]|uniref:phosphate signaling complex protein PhoU n=1 Tax=Microlunatus sp. Y1700 TaxID=3418487 RepID=UPI003B7E4BFD
MRDNYREQLDGILGDLVAMNHKVADAVRVSTKALLEADLHRAEQVISSDEQIDEIRNGLEARAFQLLARQSPVAGELRMLVASLRMVTELERMGDLAAHVAKIARMRYPECAVPDPMRGNFTRMAEVAEKMVISAGKVLANRDVAAAQDVQERDEEMDDLRKSQFRSLLSDEWTHGVEAAVDVALLGRYYERIADHADSMARRVVYIVTGEFPDDEAWPEP